MFAAPQHLVVQASDAIESYVKELGLAEIVTSGLYAGSGDVRSRCEVDFIITDVEPALTVKVAIYAPNNITLTRSVYDGGLRDTATYDSVAATKQALLELTFEL